MRPPPPPPPNPEPIVVTTTGTGESLTPSRRAPIGATRTHVPPLLDTDRLPGAEPLASGDGPIGIGRLSVDAFLELYLGGLLDRWSITLAQEPVGDQLGRGDVLDGQPDRLEDGDRVGRTGGRPVRADAADLYEVVFRH